MQKRNDQLEEAAPRQSSTTHEAVLDDDEVSIVDEGYGEVVSDEDAEPDDRRRDPLRH